MSEKPREKIREIIEKLKIKNKTMAERTTKKKSGKNKRNNREIKK